MQEPAINTSVTWDMIESAAEKLGLSLTYIGDLITEQELAKCTSDWNLLGTIERNLGKQLHTAKGEARVRLYAIRNSLRGLLFDQNPELAAAIWTSDEA